ncbi:MAG TPA: helix-turn-helix domain-containing protein [Casimicrobiaceae bacterium]
MHGYREPRLMEAALDASRWTGAIGTAKEATAPCTLTRVTNTDVGEQAASLRRWDQIYEQLTPGPFLGTLHEVCFGGVQLFRETTSQSVHEAGGAWAGSRSLGVPLAMSGAALFRGQPVRLGAVMALSGSDDLEFYAPRGFDLLGVSVDEHALREHARRVEDRDIDRLFGGRAVLVPDAARLDDFRRTLLSMLNSLDANPTALRFEPAQRLLEETVLGAIVALADGNDAAPASAPATGRQHVVERARAYMDAHIDEPMTIAGVCVALGVSRRTLQYSFHEVLGINPVRFLRALRLNGVRRDLKCAPAGATVQDTAARWGFWHLGHFVTDYKHMFGELPSATLHERSAGARRRFGAGRAPRRE